ncbi:MAG: 3-carboxymuconate cyclase [Chthoniobacteraceae bacterium]|nr:3-carboxymuconate cyclase [Chthoniobacteraceae bacterium]
MQTTDQSIYGTTSAGGASGAGTVFSIGSDGAARNLVEFTGITGAQRGAQPAAKLVLGSDGSYYGVNVQGGANGMGTLFKLLPNGTALTMVVFTGAGEKFRGAQPYAPLLAGGDGYLYGTTSRGGLYDSGTVFKVSESDGSLITLFEFGGKLAGAKGANPYAALVRGANGLLYGSTAKGGKSDDGTLFSLSTDGTVETLVEFTDKGPKNKGSAPYGSLTVGADGNFYGTTARGGGGDFGTIFRMTAAGDLTTLVELTGRSGKNRGALPEAALIAGPDGDFYGTTFGGGLDNIGTVFKVTAGGNLTTLVDFTGKGLRNRGSQPQSSLLAGADGYFYGTTFRGGEGDAGTVFKMSANGELSTVLEFAGVNPVSYFQGGIIRGKDTNFYGVTAANGVQGKGTVYRITLAGVTKTLAEFTGNGSTNSGSTPRAPLLQGEDGNFYGVTLKGGAFDFGTIFKITPAGVLTTLVEFTGNGAVNKGASPRAALIQAGGGDFYGVTSEGGAENAGTVFRLKANGSLTTLVEFTGNGAIKGASPNSSLLLGKDMNFHGTTEKGGEKGFGTIFSMTPEGLLTTQVEFADDPAGVRGAFPEAALVEGSDGNYYGTTATGGATGYGTLFRITPIGGFSTLVEFTGNRPQNRGAYPIGALFAASDGNLYGTTSFGGAKGFGTAFRMTLNGVLTTLAELDYKDGGYPENGFVLGSDGNLYTTTSGGGSFGAGAIFRLRMRTATEQAEAVAVMPDAAHLRARLNPGGLAGTMYFEYGVDSYDSRTPNQSVAAGSAETVITADLVGLLPNTVYSFRTVLTDSSGTVYGHDETFTTGALSIEVLSAGGGVDQEPDTTVLTSFGVPSIADNQAVAVMANLTTATGKETAILTGNPPVIVARKGSAAPISTPGLTAIFTAFKDPVCDASGRVAFAASILLQNKPGSGLWTNAGGAMSEVARAGGDAPGINGARFASITSYAMSGNGTVFYGGKIAGGGISSSNNTGLWAFDESGSHLLLRSGDMIGALKIVSILALSPVQGSTGQGRSYFSGTMTARVTLSDRTQAIVQLAPGVEPVVIGPTPFQLPGFPASISELGAPSISGGGTTAFLAKSSDHMAVILADSGDLKLAAVARTGTLAPGVAPANFATFADPVYNAQSNTAFLATLSGAGVTAKNRTGLWWNTSTGVSLVARAGSDVPSMPAAKWDSFITLALPDNAGPVFLARLAAGSGTPGLPSDIVAANNVGIWFVDGNKSRRLLVRTGDKLQVRGVPKTLSLITILGAVTGSPGQARSYNATGDLVFRATFTDHTQAIMRIHLP